MHPPPYRSSAALPVPGLGPGRRAPEAVIAFAQAHAARLRRKVFVTLSRRETVGMTEAGEINGQFPATPYSDPCPSKPLKRVKLLFRLGGAGGVTLDGPKEHST